MTELLQFLRPQQRIDLKSVSINNVLCKFQLLSKNIMINHIRYSQNKTALTGTTEGKDYILESAELIKAIFQLTSDKMESIAKDSILAIINLTALEDDAIKLYNASKNLSPV